MERDRKSDLVVEPARLSGTIAAIPSKSYAQRLFIASALADRPTKIEFDVPVGLSGDNYSTIMALKSIVAELEFRHDGVVVSPLAPSCEGSKKSSVCLNVEESGTAARLLLPILVALFDEGVLEGSGSLLTRPFETLCASLEAGSNVVKEKLKFDSQVLPISWRGKLQPGSYRLPGDESSQYISGLLMALPLLGGDSELVLSSPLQSVGYVDMTLDVLELFGIKIERDGDTYRIPGRQMYKSPLSVEVEGDWSNSAFWLAAGIELRGLNPQSLQLDRLFLEVKDQAEIDAVNIPDLVPILSVYAALKEGTTVITGIERLRIKESDRIETTFAMLDALGCAVELGPVDEIWTSIDEVDPFDKSELGKAWENHKLALTIHGTGDIFGGGVINGANDHRIVMAAAIAGSFAQTPVTILGAQAVAKTYPHFFEDFMSLGGHVKKRPGGSLARIFGRKEGPAKTELN